MKKQKRKKWTKCFVMVLVGHLGVFSLVMTLVLILERTH